MVDAKHMLDQMGTRSEGTFNPIYWSYRFQILSRCHTLDVAQYTILRKEVAYG